MPDNVAVQTSENATLQRALNLPLLVLYGLGTTIGAGIYVLVGSAAGHAGLYAPLAFLVAAIGIAPSAASYAELAGRYPVSAAEAVYVENGFNSRTISTLSGLLVIFSGVVAAAAITVGCAGYIRVFFDWPFWMVVSGVVLCMGAVAALGILESVLLAAIFTLIEVGGLLVLVAVGFSVNDNVIASIPVEDMVNVVEETKKPAFTMPVAIGLTLIITTMLYFLVTLVSVSSVLPSELAQSEAPLSAVYEKLTGTSAVVISAIAIFATLNTILIQFIMASRVIYGMADRSALPAVFATVNPVTRTPLVATALVVACAALLALAIPLGKLAEYTSMIILIIWAMSNTALVLIKWRKTPAPENAFQVPFWVPVLGLAFCTVFIGIAIVNG